MLKLRFATILVAVLALALPIAAVAQRGPGARTYDPKTETTLTGTVDDVQQLTGRRGFAGTHLILNTATGTLEVHLGPSSYIDAQKISFAKGDRIEVVGSKVKIGAADALIARQVTKDGKTLTLRDAQGVPQWSRGRRRG